MCRVKSTRVPAPSVRLDNNKSTYATSGKNVQFYEGKFRVFEIPPAFFHPGIRYAVRSEGTRSVTLHKPKFHGLNTNAFLSNLDLSWILVHSAPYVFKKGKTCNYPAIVKGCKENCPTACLRGFPYGNEFGDTFTTRFDGRPWT